MDVRSQRVTVASGGRSYLRFASVLGDYVTQLNRFNTTMLKEFVPTQKQDEYFLTIVCDPYIMQSFLIIQSKLIQLIFSFSGILLCSHTFILSYDLLYYPNYFYCSRSLRRNYKEVWEIRQSHTFVVVIIRRIIRAGSSARECV